MMIFDICLIYGFLIKTKSLKIPEIIPQLDILLLINLNLNYIHPIQNYTQLQLQCQDGVMGYGVDYENSFHTHEGYHLVYVNI